MSEARSRFALAVRPAVLAVWALNPFLLAQSPLPEADVARLATGLDALVEQDLARHGERPNDTVDDATFVRRAYLRILGRIPTLEETRAFLDSKSTRRRDALIDELLASPARVSRELPWYADLFRAKSRLQTQVSGEPFLDFFRKSIDANTPWDELARALVTAEGPAHARDNGATGYLLRDLNMPEDSMANTVRIFLGTRMECAQCHDHPFDRWKQQEFYELVAFQGGIRYRDDELLRGERARELATLTRELRGREDGANLARAARRMFLPLATGISGSGTGVTRLPDDYRGDDLRPGSFIEAATIFGDAVELPDAQPLRRGRARAARNNRRLPTHADIGSREAFAAWLTSPQNPRFTRVIANRVWKRVFGVGLIEPVDDLRDDTAPSNPELMALLEQLMLDVDYDLREFQRVLYRSETWQRRAGVVDPDADEPYRFPGPALVRLSAEQMWDSLLTLTVDDVDSTIAPPGARAEPVYARYEELAELDGDELRARIEREALRYENPQEYRRMIAAERAQMRQEREQPDAATQARMRELMAELRRARQQGDQARVRELAAELRSLRQADTRPVARGLVRASELGSPAPEGHFLREFGQSDREQIENAFDDATAPQALALMNGIVERQVMDRRSSLARQLASAKDDQELVTTAFLAILSREPSRDELRTWRGELRDDRERGARDLVWTLCNTHEFRFLQ